MDVTYEQLQKYAKMETEEDVQKFELGIGAITETKDQKILELLIDLFDDECPYYEVMYSLVHTIETYPKEIYVEAVLKKVGDGVEKYPFWIDCICNRIFNDSISLILFRKNMNKSNKEYLLKLFDIMERESPHHKKLITILRKELDSSHA